jgi:hypothetical protein
MQPTSFSAVGHVLYLRVDAPAREPVGAEVANMEAEYLSWSLLPVVPGGARLHAGPDSPDGSAILEGCTNVWISAGTVATNYTLRAVFLPATEIDDEMALAVVAFSLDRSRAVMRSSSGATNLLTAASSDGALANWSVDPPDVLLGAGLSATGAASSFGPTAEGAGTVWVKPGDVVTNYTVTAIHPDHTNVTASADLVVADIALEPVTTERLADNRLYNPSSVPFGEYRRFKVKVEAAAGAVPDTDVEWELPPNVTLRPGLTGGRVVELTASEPGTNTVTVRIADLAGPPPQISFAGHTPTNIPVRFMIICRDNGTDPATTPQNCTNLVLGANRILEQVGISLTLQSVAFTNRQDWYAPDPDDGAIIGDLMSSMPPGDGFEAYMVNDLPTGTEPNDFYWGINSWGQGSALKEGALARVLAHELLHQCGLDDIYSVHPQTLQPHYLVRSVPDHLPADYTGAWNYYGNGLLHKGIIDRLLMGPGNENLVADLPLGTVSGIYIVSRLPSGAIYELGDVDVGFGQLDSPITGHQ